MSGKSSSTPKGKKIKMIPNSSSKRAKKDTEDGEEGKEFFWYGVPTSSRSVPHKTEIHKRNLFYHTQKFPVNGHDLIAMVDDKEYPRYAIGKKSDPNPFDEWKGDKNKKSYPPAFPLREKWQKKRDKFSRMPSSANYKRYENAFSNEKNPPPPEKKEQIKKKLEGYHTTAKSLYENDSMHIKQLIDKVQKKAKKMVLDALEIRDKYQLLEDLAKKKGWSEKAIAEQGEAGKVKNFWDEFEVSDEDEDDSDDDVANKTDDDDDDDLASVDAN